MLSIPRILSPQRTSPDITYLQDIATKKVRAEIKNPDGSIVFEMDDVEVPVAWGPLAVNILASKFLRKAGVPDGKGGLGPERSIRQVVHRIVNTIAQEGIAKKIFDEASAKIFYDEYCCLLINQMIAFNSPVFFSMGLWHEYKIKGPKGYWAWQKGQYLDEDTVVETGRAVEIDNMYERPCASACYIHTIEDSMEGIYKSITTESKIFRSGAGAGANYSAIRGKDERLSGGGKSSGLISFLEVFDKSAGAIKSGGTVRRAARMVTVDIDHPEVIDFIKWKAKEEKKAKALILAGYDADFNGEAYQTISGQNANNSVAITDEFMVAVEADQPWHLMNRTDGKVASEHKARMIFDEIAQAAWECAEPGVNFISRMNEWNMVPKTAQICSTNPCCFVGSTLVHTSTGYTKIETLENWSRNGADLPTVGAYDQETQTFIERQILRVWESGQATKLVEVATAMGLILRCTPEHRFLIYSDETFCLTEYEEAQNLRPNHVLVTQGGLRCDRVFTVTHYEEQTPVPVYDVEIEGIHNFGVTHKESGHSVTVSNSEFCFVDNSSCNLSCLNLLQFMRSDGLQIQQFKHACFLSIIAQEILVDLGSYPTKEICENSHNLRPLGLGYTNLGALLMQQGFAYDSDEGRALAASITSLMTAQAYRTSTALAYQAGAFQQYDKNKEDCLRVLEKHKNAHADLMVLVEGLAERKSYQTINPIAHIASEVWTDCLAHAHAQGLRNAQVSLCMPAGTVGLLMDSQTLGIEPDFALTKYKTLAGGGSMKIVNNGVSAALKTLGYQGVELAAIEAFLTTHGTMVGSGLKENHYPVFDCAVEDNAGRYIAPMGHVKMLAALQPFLSGSLSKTINCPEHTTVQEIQDLYLQAWKSGLKCLAVYRDNSKGSQPLSNKATPAPSAHPAQEILAIPAHLPASMTLHQGQRKRLPRQRAGFTEKAVIGGQTFYIQAGKYADGSLGEIFLTSAKSGSSMQGLLNAIAVSVSIGLQYGVPLEEYVQAFVSTVFAPNGMTDHPQIRFTTSLLDYTFRVLEIDATLASGTVQETKAVLESENASPLKTMSSRSKVGEMCLNCGGLLLRSGSCWVCSICSISTGCS